MTTRQLYAPSAHRGILRTLPDIDPDARSVEPDPWDVAPYAHQAAFEKKWLDDEYFCLLS